MSIVDTVKAPAPERPAPHNGVRAVLGFAADKGRTVIVLAVICVIFWQANETFLTPINLSNLILQTAATGMISAGIVLVLLLGEVDLSAGAVSGLCAGVMGILSVNQGWNPWLAITAAIVAGAFIGWLQGVIAIYLQVPSFIITLAGLLVWQGGLLFLLRDGGTINISDDTILAIAITFLPGWLSWTIGLAASAGYLVLQLVARRRQIALGVEPDSVATIAMRSGLAVAGTVALIVLLSADRGVPVSLVLLLVVISVMHVVLTSTKLGRYIYAVGGSSEAANRVGIPVKRIKVIAFAACSAIAALGGIMAASRLQSATQSAGGSDILLLAIAGPVIAGVSLFGGRGSVWGALLGALIIGAISNGMDLLSVDASVKLMVTGAVLVAAVAIDALAAMRRRRTGRI